MATKRIVPILAVILVLAGCGSQVGPRFSIRTYHPARAIARLACISQDCGPYVVTIHWAGISIASQTGYYVYKDGEQVADTASATYTFHGIDCGVSFTVGIRAHDGVGATSSLHTTNYSAPACSNGNGPENVVAPVVSTDPLEASGMVAGQEVATTTGTWSGSPTSYSYQWQRCNPSCSNIEGETEPIYILHSTDVGYKLQVIVTATNGAGSTPATTAQTSTVTTSSGSTYYIADNGSDSNNGTSKATPWAHAPGMTGCSNTCLSVLNAGGAGTQFIFKGGDTWDFTGANGAVAGLPWTWDPSPYVWYGVAGRQNYVGVDRSWFSGASWSRPILNGDNPTAGSPVGSCTRDDSASDILTNTGSWVTFDGFEVTGVCYPAAGATGGGVMLGPGYNTNDDKYVNFYIHGWSHTGDYGQLVQIWHGATSGPNFPDTKDEWAYNIVDGSDTDRSSGTVDYGDCYSFNHNYMRYVNNMVCNNSKTINNNVFEYFNEDNSPAGPDQDHGNVFEENQDASAPIFFYNNVIRHIGLANPIGVGLWLDGSEVTYYTYNNTMYDIVTGAGGTNWINCGSGHTGLCTGMRVYSNTLQNGQGTSIFTGSVGPSANNHFIDDAGVFASPPASSTTDLTQTNAQATSAGYTLANQYQPTSAGSPTVGTGTNEASLCGTLPEFCSDTTSAVGLSGSTLTFPARVTHVRSASSSWDKGAYQWEG